MIEAAIAHAEERRRELEARQPEARQSAKVPTVLPKAAELFRREVELGLRGDERAATKARVLLRELLRPHQPEAGRRAVVGRVWSAADGCAQSRRL